MFKVERLIVSLGFGILVLFQANAQFIKNESAKEYEERINDLLSNKKDIIGESLILSGGANYKNIQGYLRPLYYSAGRKIGAEQGVHNVLYAEENGIRPFFVAIADGSRIAMNLYDNPNDITIKVGENGDDVYGTDLNRLQGPFLAGDYYPILKTYYRSKNGVEYSQESFASHVNGVRPLVAMVKLTAISNKKIQEKIVIRHGRITDGKRVLYSAGELRDSIFTYSLKLIPGKEQTLYYYWSPTQDFPINVVADEKRYNASKINWMNHWDNSLSGGVQFNVPEKIVMDCQKNLLIQNLVLRHRYSLGNNAYDESLYHPESCDAATTLAKYGFTNEARNALEVIYGAGLNTYANWVRGEQLTHSAEYYHLTKDYDFMSKWTNRFKTFFLDFEGQIKKDTFGLLTPQPLSSDISTEEYYTYQQAVAWRGWRDIATILKDLNLYNSDTTKIAVQQFRKNLLLAINSSKSTIDDGALFIPSILHAKKKEIYSPISETKLGSYWNLCMPYAFDSGIFDYKSKEMGQILNFMHNHGGLLLGMLRFNFYATPIGDFLKGGIPGYYTTGVDNVYLISYMRALAQRDESERLILSFYGRLVHGQTKHTFSSGEGDNIGVYPGVENRCSFGSWNSANNLTLLESLRYMLLCDSYDFETGVPNELRFAHSTPREWLENGKVIEFNNAPTIFGNASCRIVSGIDKGKINVNLYIPTRDPIEKIFLKLRLPQGKRIQKVKLQGRDYPRFDSEKELIDLRGFKGQIELIVECN